MFERTLTDLIRGLRANQHDQETYIAAALADCREEVQSNDIRVKANAVAKLAHLHMLGHDMTWASFYVVEAMSASDYVCKRAGYQAACISFQQDTDVLMLCTNQIRKDLRSNQYMEAVLALHGLAQIVTPGLSVDLLPDLLVLLNHSRPYMRKRVVLTCYKVFLQYPEALRTTYPKLKELLHDPDASVQSAVINVVCELARRNPRSYLSLVPVLYDVLTTSANNWILIKLVKLFAALVPLEPRLAKKLTPALVKMIQTTSAMSLLYECIHTVVTSGMIPAEPVDDGTASADADATDTATRPLAALVLAKIGVFVTHADHNLKYLGLQVLGKLLAIRPADANTLSATVLACLENPDASIRETALQLVARMTRRATLAPVIKRLQAALKVSPSDALGGGDGSGTSAEAAETWSDAAGDDNLAALAEWRRRVVQTILLLLRQHILDEGDAAPSNAASETPAANALDFEWYLSVLGRLARIPNLGQGGTIGDQLRDVAMRVPDLRRSATKLALQLVSSPALLAHADHPYTNIGVLEAAIELLGEYPDALVMDASQPLGLVQHALKRLASPSMATLPVAVQCAALHAAVKLMLFQRALAAQHRRWADGDDALATTKQIVDGFLASSHIEVQERAFTFHAILAALGRAAAPSPSSSSSSSADDETATLVAQQDWDALAACFRDPLLPVSATAQRRVKVPEGLTLDVPIADLASPEAADDEEEAEEDDDAAAAAAGASDGQSERDGSELAVSADDPSAKRSGEAVDLSVFYLGGPPSSQAAFGASGSVPTKALHRNAPSESAARPPPAKVYRVLKVQDDDDDDDGDGGDGGDRGGGPATPVGATASSRPSVVASMASPADDMDAHAHLALDLDTRDDDDARAAHVHSPAVAAAAPETLPVPPPPRGTPGGRKRKIDITSLTTVAIDAHDACHVTVRLAVWKHSKSRIWLRSIRLEPPAAAAGAAETTADGALRLDGALPSRPGVWELEHVAVGREPTVMQLTLTWPAEPAWTARDIGRVVVHYVIDGADDAAVKASRPHAVAARFTDVMIARDALEDPALYTPEAFVALLSNPQRGPAGGVAGFEASVTCRLPFDGGRETFAERSTAVAAALGLTPIVVTEDATSLLAQTRVHGAAPPDAPVPCVAGLLKRDGAHVALELKGRAAPLLERLLYCLPDRLAPEASDAP